MKLQIPIYDPETKTMKFPVQALPSTPSRASKVGYNQQDEYYVPHKRTKLTDEIKIQALQSQSLQTYQYARNVKQFADVVDIDGIESQLVFLKQGIGFLERLIQEVKDLKEVPIKNE